MVFMSSWTLRAGSGRDAVKKFLAGGGQPPDGVKLIQRWHACDLSGGFSLVESDDPAAMHAYSASWMDLVDIRTVPVVGDAEAGANLAKHFGG